MRTLPLFVLSVFLFAATAFTQDSIKVDPKHYKVEIDNPQVRVLRIPLRTARKIRHA